MKIIIWICWEEVEKVKNLISLEIRKVLLKPHMFGLAAANIIIFLLSVFTSSLLTQNGNMPVAAIILGAIGIAFSAMALHKIVASDLNN